MSIRICSALIGMAVLVSGCASRTHQQTNVQPDPTLSFKSSAISYVEPNQASLHIGNTDWVIAPIPISELKAADPTASKLASGSARIAWLVTADGFEQIGRGTWINFTVFNRITGKATLGLNRRAIVWQMVRSPLDPDGLLLLMSDLDTSRDGTLDDRDATSVHRLNLSDGTLTRLTPANTTVVGSRAEQPNLNPTNADKENSGLFGRVQNVAQALYITVATDANNDGVFAPDEPRQIIRIDPTQKQPPQTVLDAQQWQRALAIWNGRA